MVLDFQGNVGQSYIIECNSNGGEGIVEVTGVNQYEKLIKFCEESNGKKEVRQPGRLQDHGPGYTVSMEADDSHGYGRRQVNGRGTGKDRAKDATVNGSVVVNQNRCSFFKNRPS